MLTKSNLLEILEKELKRSLLLSEEDKSFWLDNLSNLSLRSVKNLLSVLQPKNHLVDAYLDAGLEVDERQEYLKKIKEEVSRIKQKAFEAEEKFEAVSEKEFCEDLLNQF